MLFMPKIIQVSKLGLSLAVSLEVCRWTVIGLGRYSDRDLVWCHACSLANVPNLFLEDPVRLSQFNVWQSRKRRSNTSR